MAAPSVRDVEKSEQLSKSQSSSDSEQMFDRKENTLVDLDEELLVKQKPKSQHQFSKFDSIEEFSAKQKRVTEVSNIQEEEEVTSME